LSIRSIAKNGHPGDADGPSFRADNRNAFCAKPQRKKRVFFEMVW
jgi:hypothetical protein